MAKRIEQYGVSDEQQYAITQQPAANERTEVLSPDTISPAVKEIVAMVETNPQKAHDRAQKALDSAATNGNVSPDEIEVLNGVMTRADVLIFQELQRSR